MKLQLTLLTGALFATTSIAAVAPTTVTPDAAKGPSAEILTGRGKAKLSIEPRNWDNTLAVTESGRRFRLIDPFLYNLRDAKFDRYLSHTTIWPGVKAEVAADGALRLECAPPELGLKKTAILRPIPGANAILADVRAEVIGDKTVRIVYNNQNIYLTAPLNDFELYIDGKAVELAGKQSFKNFRTICFYQSRLGYSIALITHPAPNSFTLANTNAKDGNRNIDISWGLRPSDCPPKTQMKQSYIIAWGDGNLNEALNQIEASSRIPVAPDNLSPASEL